MFLIKVTRESGTYLVDKRTSRKNGICIHSNPTRAKQFKTRKSADDIAARVNVWPNTTAEVIPMGDTSC
jgi:hypothetical protein